MADMVDGGLPLRVVTRSEVTARRSGWWRVAAGVAVCLLVGWVAVRGLLPAGAEDGAPPLTQPGEARWIAALGHLEPAAGLVGVTAARTARDAVVAQVLVAAGQEVRAGDALAVLETLPRAEAAVAEAEAAVALRAAEVAGARRAAEAALATAEAEEALAALRLDEAERALVRADRLAEERAVAVATRDDLRTARDLRQAELARARAEVARLSGGVEALPDMRAAVAALAQAEAALRVARIGVAEATIRAPFDGRVLSVAGRVGEPVPTEGVARLAVAGGMVALLEVHQDHVGALRAGAAVTLRAGAFDGNLTGRVTWIGQEVRRQAVFSDDPSANTDARVFEVRVTLDDRSAARATAWVNLQVLARIGVGAEE